MFRLLKTIVIFNIFCLNNVLARSDGAPTINYPDVCSDMMPRDPHSPTMSSDPSPYTVNVDKTYYKPGEEITVTITGSQIINGLLLQARVKDTGEVIGNFIKLPTKLRKASCPQLQEGQTVTHKELIKSNTISVKWLSPANVSTVANISFLATVVKSLEEYWVKLESAQLYNSKPKANAKPSVATTETIVTRDVKSTAPVFHDISSMVMSTSLLTMTKSAVRNETEITSTQNYQNMSTVLPMTTTSTTKCPSVKCAGYTCIANICVTILSAFLVIGYILVFEIV